MSIESYDKYILAHPTEPVEFHKIVFFSTMEMPEKQNVKANIHRLFTFCDDPDTYITDHLLAEAPVLFWDNQSMLEKYGVSEAHQELSKCSTYNSPEGIIVSKVDTLKMLQKTQCPFIPRTVYSREEAAKLQFPLIAKASNTYQSRGVELVKNKTELNKLTKGFNLYQEQIAIDEEYRLLFFRGKNIGTALLAAFKREPENEKAKSLRVNEADSPGPGMKADKLEAREKSDFSWTQFNPYHNKKMDLMQCYTIAQHIFHLNPTLNVAGLDIAVDKKGMHWFIECNSTPGLFSNSVPLIYKFIYEDHYGRLQEYASRRLRDMCHYFAALTREDEPTFKVQGNGENPDHYILNQIDGFVPHVR